MEQEKKMEFLNKQVVDFDGDIPMEKLAELQNKLKNKNEKATTDVTYIND